MSGVPFCIGDAVERITLLYGSNFRNGRDTRLPLSGWLGEYLALEKTGLFHIAFFNYADFIRGGKLEVAVQKWISSFEKFGFVTDEQYASRVKPKKRDSPTILRCPYVDEGSYKTLERELLRFGYRLIIDSWESQNYGELRFYRGFPTDPYMIASASAGSSFGSSGYYSLQPTIYLARDEEGPADTSRHRDFFATGWVTGDMSQKIADDFAAYRGGKPIGKVFFEKYIPYAVFRNAPVAWRVLFFDGVPFYKGLVAGDSKGCADMPEPPSEVISAFAEHMGVFGSCDLVLVEGGGWKCARIMDGQFTMVPLGGDADDYAAAFVKVVSESPHVSKSWCLTARVKDKNTIGEDHRVVRGTRHFAPGTKVWLHDPNWDGRVGAIGVPRYSNKLTRIVMDVRKLENFNIEMVCDREILAALAHPRRAWPFTRLANIEVGRWVWDASDECRDEILRDIEWLEQLTSKERTNGQL